TTINCNHNNKSSVSDLPQGDAPSQPPMIEKVGGIPNLGATCYMNSVLQILKSFYLPKINEKSDELANSLQNLMATIAEDKEIATRAEALAVFKGLNTQFGWTTDYSEQKDAEELISKFFTWMGLP